ncbi:MAG: DUF2384 domain-containing protein [Sphingomonadaceae bacterium]|nr:DUF2384 domain-containing protein [Sphingomonadaceae bacterium]
MLATFFDDIRDGDIIAPRRLAERLRVPLTGLARITRLNRNTLAGRPASPAVQARLGEVTRIIARAAAMTGDEGRAIIWFRHQPIIGFAGKTAEELVEDGHAEAVMSHLDDLDNGVYA